MMASFLACYCSLHLVSACVSAVYPTFTCKSMYCPWNGHCAACRESTSNLVLFARCRMHACPTETPCVGVVLWAPPGTLG